LENPVGHAGHAVAGPHAAGTIGARAGDLIQHETSLTNARLLTGAPSCSIIERVFKSRILRMAGSVNTTVDTGRKERADRLPEGMGGLAKGLAIIEAFSAQRTRMTVSDAAQASGTSRAFGGLFRRALAVADRAAVPRRRARRIARVDLACGARSRRRAVRGARRIRAAGDDRHFGRHPHRPLLLGDRQGAAVGVVRGASFGLS